MNRITPAGCRRRRARRVAPLVLSLLAALAVPAAGHAESLTLAVGADPVAGVLSAVDYEVDTGGAALTLTIVTRPATGPGCQSTPGMDATLAGAAATTYLTPNPIAVQGVTGSRIPYLWPMSGPQRVCGWLHRSADDVVAAAAASADVRLPKASISISAEQVRPRPAGADIAVRATGTVEAAADVLITAVPDYEQCPLSYDEDAAPRIFLVTPAGTPTRLSGGFDLSFTSRTRFSYGIWRVCAFVQDGEAGDDASAVATTRIELVNPPSAIRNPRVKRAGRFVSCDGGRWRGAPKPKLAYAWLAGSKKLKGTGRKLAVTSAVKGKSVRCRVTATNKAGKGTATSKALKVK